MMSTGRSELASASHQLPTAIVSLRRRYPGVEITLVVGSWCEALASSLLPVDIITVYDSPSFDRAVDGRRGGDAVRLRAILNGPYDFAYGLREDAATLGFCLRGGCGWRGDRGTVRVRDRLLRLGSRLTGRGDPGPLGERETNLRIVGAPPGEALGDPLLSPCRDDVEHVLADVRKAFGDAAGAPLVVLHPGAAWVHRRWGVERFAELAARVSEELGAHVFVTGSRGERELAESVLAGGVRGRVVAGEYTIGQTAALLSLADVYVGPDTGITHLAAAVGAPVVALFGPGDPRRFGGSGERDIIVYHRQDCSPCPQTVCGRDSACMRAITVDEVESAVRRALSVDGARSENHGAAA